MEWGIKIISEKGVYRAKKMRKTGKRDKRKQISIKKREKDGMRLAEYIT